MALFCGEGCLTLKGDDTEGKNTQTKRKGLVVVIIIYNSN